MAPPPRPQTSPAPVTLLAYDGTRTPAKTALFVVVCLAWILPGLVGHDPWKSDEAIAMGVVSEMLRSGNWLVPTLAGEPYPERAPLFFWLAAASAGTLGKFLPLHDAARLASGFFVAVTLASVMVAASALHGPRAGRLAGLLLLGCFGLLIRAHEMSADLAALAGVAMGVAGVTLAPKMPKRGGLLVGVGLAAAFLGNGLISALLVIGLAALAPLAWPAARSRPYGLAMAIALGCALMLGGLWPLLVSRADPAFWSAWSTEAFATRWATDDFTGAASGLTYFAKILPWYAWPALPLAAWTLWKSRRGLAGRLNLRVPMLATALFFVLLTLLAEAREVNAMPLLIPLVLLGVAEVDNLPRGAASALDWFGVMTFALVALLLWLAFAAALTGSPEAVARWLAREVPGYHYSFRFVPVALAALLTCVWVVVVASSLRSPRRAVVNWAAGITMVWMLTMMLGVPIIDQARSYRGLSASVAERVKGSTCTLGAGLGVPQRALLDYFIGLRLTPATAPGAETCDTLLVQSTRGLAPEVDAARWQETWRGSRPGDGSEAFILYRRSS